MNITELRDWAIKYDIEKDTKTAFFKMLENYKADDPNEYNEVFKNFRPDELQLEVHTISLNLGNWPECSYNTISASMRISHNGKQIGSYKTLYTLDGSPEDDFFEIF